MAVIRKQVTLDETIVKKIEQRGKTSEIICRDLGRLYDMYGRSLWQVQLSLEEACLITDCLNGRITDARFAPTLAHSVADGIALDGLAAKWEVDGKDLVAKLESFSEIQCMAIIDRVDQYWEFNDQYADFRIGVAEVFGIKKD